MRARQANLSAHFSFCVCCVVFFFFFFFFFLLMIRRPPRSTLDRSSAASDVYKRQPYRPNQIGLSCVKLDKVEGLKIHISESDLLDGSPILDIKPCLLYTSPSPRDRTRSRMPSSA